MRISTLRTQSARILGRHWSRVCWFLAWCLITSLPLLALADDAQEFQNDVDAAGGVLKSFMGYVVVLIGIGLGIAAISIPGNLIKQPGKK